MTIITKLLDCNRLNGVAPLCHGQDVSWCACVCVSVCMCICRNGQANKIGLLLAELLRIINCWCFRQSILLACSFIQVWPFGPLKPVWSHKRVESVYVLLGLLQKAKPSRRDGSKEDVKKHSRSSSSSSDSDSDKEHGRQKMKKTQAAPDHRRQKQEQSDENFDEIWKKIFLENERRRALGEKEFRILKARERREKVNVLRQTTRELRTSSKSWTVNSQ